MLIDPVGRAAIRKVGRRPRSRLDQVKTGIGARPLGSPPNRGADGSQEAVMADHRTCRAVGVQHLIALSVLILTLRRRARSQWFEQQ
jgi:hypothetical protein